MPLVNAVIKTHGNNYRINNIKNLSKILPTNRTAAHLMTINGNSANKVRYLTC
uniref:Uncharacterized protein n=1 Tax=Arundo donax TaxID=35708 RepID=A0A0A8YIU8_ARUDO